MNGGSARDVINWLKTQSHNKKDSIDMEKEIIKPESLKGKKVILGYKFKRNKTTDEPEFGFFEDDVKSAVLQGIKLANEFEDLESRGNTLEVLRKSFPDIFQELKEST